MCFYLECIPMKQSQEITGKFPGYLSPSAGLKFADVPNGLAAISKVPAAGQGWNNWLHLKIKAYIYIYTHNIYIHIYIHKYIYVYIYIYKTSVRHFTQALALRCHHISMTAELDCQPHQRFHSVWHFLPSPWYFPSRHMLTGAVPIVVFATFFTFS